MPKRPLRGKKRPLAVEGLGKYPVASKARKYEAHDFSEFLEPCDMSGYKSAGSWTSRAYNQVLYHTGNKDLASMAYKASAAVWRERH